jgi:uncharacterized membrane protein
MRLSARSLAFAIGITTAFIYMLCVLFIAFAPQSATIFFGYILHLIDLEDLSKFEGKVLRTSLSHVDEAKLQAALTKSAAK